MIKPLCYEVHGYECAYMNVFVQLFSGYMPLEYVMEGVLSTKSDVFSFGVLLLEIVSGQKNYSSYHSERPLNLIGYVSS